jgi:hypothetical protein
LFCLGTGVEFFSQKNIGHFNSPKVHYCLAHFCELGFLVVIFQNALRHLICKQIINFDLTITEENFGLLLVAVLCLNTGKYSSGFGIVKIQHITKQTFAAVVIFAD